MRRVALVILGYLLLRVTADSQEPQARGLRLVGSAVLNGKMLRLTPAERHMAGAAWFEKKLTVSGGFETSFEFQLTGQGGLGPGADRFAFVLQNSGRMRWVIVGPRAGSRWERCNGMALRKGFRRALRSFSTPSATRDSAIRPAITSRSAPPETAADALASTRVPWGFH
jgi:hypothetical protein